jgi:GNAT superfamily N-acetyltransferase
MNFQIREATPADVPAIHQLIIELAIYEKEPDAVDASEGDIHAALFSGEKSKSGQPAAFAHVATVEDEVVGIAIWFLNYSTWQGVHGIYLEDLYVKTGHRGSGIGKALLKTLAKLCVDRGYGRFQWWVLDWNQPSIDFYKAHGAVAMDEWTVYRLAGEDLKKMAIGEI